MIALQFPLALSAGKKNVALPCNRIAFEKIFHSVLLDAGSAYHKVAGRETVLRLDHLRHFQTENRVTFRQHSNSIGCSFELSRSELGLVRTILDAFGPCSLLEEEEQQGQSLPSLLCSINRLCECLERGGGRR